MKKINIIKKRTDFTRIIKSKQSIKSKNFIVSFEINKLDRAMFGITVSSKNTTAVERNKLKRQIKSIIDSDKKVYKNSINYIIIIKKEAIKEKYNLLDSELKGVLFRVKGEINEKK